MLFPFYDFCTEIDKPLLVNLSYPILSYYFWHYRDQSLHSRISLRHKSKILFDGDRKMIVCRVLQSCPIRLDLNLSAWASTFWGLVKTSPASEDFGAVGGIWAKPESTPSPNVLPVCLKHTIKFESANPPKILNNSQNSISALSFWDQASRRKIY